MRETLNEDIANERERSRVKTSKDRWIQQGFLSRGNEKYVFLMFDRHRHNTSIK